jgi:hypothetical protein
MHFDKALTARLALRDASACKDSFDTLLAEIENLPNEVKGAQSLSFAARLVELAAYALAGQVDSTRVGTLIRHSAELSDLAFDVAEHHIASQQSAPKKLQ